MELKNIYIYICMYVFMYVFMYVCMCVCMYVCMYACMFVGCVWGVMNRNVKFNHFIINYVVIKLRIYVFSSWIIEN